VTSGGNNLIDFTENQLTKFRAVYTVKVNYGPKICHQSRKKLKSRILWGSTDPSPPKWCPWIFIALVFGASH